MSRVAQVLSVERLQDDGGHGVDVKADPGGEAAVLAPMFADPGDDALPLPGDFVALEDSSGTGVEQATGFADVRNAGKAKPGEKRIYARSSSGAVKIELYLRGDGTLLIGNGKGAIELAADGTVTINGVTISTAGVIATQGDVAVKGVVFSSHVHVSASPGSPTGPAQSPPLPPTP